VLVFAVAITAGLGAPLAVIQILIVNLLTDGLPALALARDPASPETMRSPPRPGDELFDARTWRTLLWIGALVGASTFAAFAIGRALAGEMEQTMAFATLALAELALVYGMRSATAPAWQAPRNRWLDASVFASAAVVGAAVYLPGANAAFAATPLDVTAAVIVLALALVPLAGVELLKAQGRSNRPPALRTQPRLRAVALATAPRWRPRSSAGLRRVRESEARVTSSSPP
jgi:Ca2+-transporting ATPase